MTTTATKERPKIEAPDVVKALHSRYAGRQSGEYVCVTEVADSTGGANRRCDFMAMSCWRSSGLALHGHEIKVSRSDWQKEMQDVTKAEAFAQHCHYWWLVYANKAASLEEIPITWGAIEVTAGGVAKVRRQAPKRTPELLPWHMIASLLRSCANQYKSSEFRDGELHKQFEAGRECERTILTSRLESAEKKAKSADDALQEILHELGEPKGWRYPSSAIEKIRKASKFLESQDVDWIGQALVTLRDKADRLEKAIAELAT